VKASEIRDYDAAFMTGTSPMVLPFYCINEVSFNVKLPVIDILRKLYLEKAENSTLQFRPTYRKV
jgi:hypothetical protein